jgi:hypothetical protein
MRRSVYRTGKIIILLSLILTVGLAVYILVVTWKAPMHKVDYINNLYPDTSSIVSDNVLLGLEKDELFIKSRLRMAASDSIGLTVDLTDSTFKLELKGVVIHRAAIVNFENSKILSLLNREAEIKWIYSPLKIDSSHSTIVKEPIVYKKAPADSVEAAAQSSIPSDSIETGPVYYNLFLSNGLIVRVEQTDMPSDDESFRAFIIKERKYRTKHLIHNLVRFQVPDYDPWIHLYLDKDDATTIFRALPYHAQVTVRI